MIGTLMGIGAVAAAFMAVFFVNIQAGCGTDCGSCDRPCKVQDREPGETDVEE
jgi:hypothetical protein